MTGVKRLCMKLKAASWSKHILMLILTLGICLVLFNNYNEQNLIYSVSTNIITNVYSAELNKVNAIPRSSKKYVKVEFSGRLGNLMFEYASLYGIAKHHNITPIVEEGCKLRTFFKISAVSVKPLLNLKRYVEKKGNVYEENAFKLDTKYNWTLKGYFQSWKYFIKNSREIRKEFQFKENVQTEATKQFQEIIKSKNITNVNRHTFIAVHVRRGDFVNNQHFVNFGYSSANESYINNAMTKFRSQFSNAFFIFSSDDIAWCKNHFNESNIAFINKKNSPEIDMAIMSHCNHTIVTTGSYGWWTAWLIGGTTIYFKDFPRKGSKLDKIFDSTTYNLPSWMAM
ncbi:galactoside 2-alpha-L-fucosyltransferase Sec1-like isoform X1 [Mytilus galloprovincialis]|uniref:galactoside 2-alpha-L-fucosyltransferase Sec1-like isoform X1 n=2 Tax=Mytilus galloprovincialis TaxID=29158 RepID=UPI003F7C7824